MEPTDAAIGATIISVLSILATKGVDAIIKWRKQESEDARAARQAANADSDADDARADKAYKDVIAALQKRVNNLEAEVVNIRAAYDKELRERQKDHEECIRMTAQLQAQIDMLTRDKTARDAAKE